MTRTTNVNEGQWLATGLDAFVVLVFSAKFWLVARWYRRQPRPRTLEPLVVAVTLLIGALALLGSGLAVRALPAALAIDVVSLGDAMMRVALIISGLWLLLYWRSRS